MHCHKFGALPVTRREMLTNCAKHGFGVVALASLLGDAACAAPKPPGSERALAPETAALPRQSEERHLPLHGWRAVAGRYLRPQTPTDTGAWATLSGHDPAVAVYGAWHGIEIALGVPPYGKSGISVSDLFPHVGACVDDMTIIRSMVSDHPEHTNANFFLHSGNGMQGRPSMGAWATYGLGSVCQNLPGFIVLNSGIIPPGGVDCFTNGFLPASYQGSCSVKEPIPLPTCSAPNPTPAPSRRKLP